MAESPIAFAHPQPLIAQFDLPDLTSDGGLPWLAEADTQLGLCAALAAQVSEWRRGPVRHTRETLVRQRVFQLAVAMPIIRHPKFQPSRQPPILEARQRPNPCKEVRPMGTAIKRVTTVDELVSATQDSGIRRIVFHGNLAGVPSLRLLPGQSLEGEGDYATVTFVEGTDGLQLSSDNQVQNISLRASPVKRAIFNDASVANLGRIALAGVTATGQVQILARDEVRGGHIDVNGLDILSADARGQPGQPNGYGVNVIQGAFTLWNMQPEDDVAITADLVGLSAGRAGAPVLGSGIFVSGAGFNGGRLVARRLETGGVYSDGKIAPGTPDQITGGVFTVYNAHVGTVRNRGPVVTYGVNDMALDNWGFVDRWIAEDKITSYGPSGIGFVNFGIVNELRVLSPIETYGQGSRGFNVYTGTVTFAEFDRITTHADGAVGIQISQPIGRPIVRRGIETFGGTGQSLVKGVVTTLSAIGLSIKPGGSARDRD